MSDHLAYPVQVVRRDAATSGFGIAVGLFLVLCFAIALTYMR
jgi:hypothetical protein